MQVTCLYALLEVEPMKVLHIAHAMKYMPDAS